MKTKLYLDRRNRFQNPAFKKSFKLLFSALALGLLFGGALLLKTSSIAKAAACSLPATTYGTDTITTSSSGGQLAAPATGTIDVWSRIQVPSTTSAAFMLQVTDTTTNTTTCFSTVGSSSIPANTWTWTDQNGSASSLAQISATSGDSLKIEYIGLQSGVKLDEFLLLPDSAQCTPTDSAGDPCTTVSTGTGVTIPYYMMAGTSANYTDTTGITWLADQTNYLTTQNSYGSTTGVTKGGDGSTCSTGTLANTNCTTHTIANATDSKVYQTERWGSFTYTVPVAAGSYNVVLKEAEINPPTSGTRSFNATVNGTQDLTNFTMPTTYTADDQTFPVTVSSSGTDANEIVIAFATVSDSAKLSALEILPANQTPPTINITAPTSGATVTGTQTLGVALGNTSGTTSVSYQVVSSTGTTTSAGTSSTSPYSVSWNSTAVADGSYTLKATVTSNGQTATASEPITVNNNTCTAAPTAPTGLKDTDSSPLPANKVDLSWTAPQPATNCTISGYNIYRSTSQSGTYTKLNASPVTSTTPYPDSTVSANTTYYYEATTVYLATTNASGPESTKSTPAVSVTTGLNCTQVSNGLSTSTLTQTAGTTSYTQVGMSWTASGTINGNGCTFSGYNLYRVVNGTATLIYTGTATSFTDTGSGLSGNVLVQNTTYNYYVQAYDSGGNKSTYTQVAMTTLKDNIGPSTPTGLAASNVTSNSVTLTWNPSTDEPNPGAVGVQGYNIYVNDASTPANTSLITGTTWTDPNIQYTNSPYKFAVQAVDNNQNPGSISADISPVIIPAPTCSGTSSTTPQSFSGTQTANSVTLTWKAVTPPAGCTLQGYEIFKNNSPLSQPVTSSPFTDSSLAPGQYQYFIETVYTNGPASLATSTLTFTIADTTPPNSPTSFNATPTSPTQVQLAWSGASDNVGITKYVITRTNGGNTTTLPTQAGTATSYVDSSVSASTTYTYSITAYDAANNASTPPATAQAITPAPTGQTPQPPTALQSILVTSNFVAVTWNASTGATSYTIVRTGPNNQTQQFTTTATEFGDSGLSYNTSYTYTVAAENGAGSSSSNPSLTVQTLSAPPVNDLVGDISGPGGQPDGHVDIFDLTVLLINWGKANATYLQGNLNNDPTVDIFDLTTLLINWTG